MNGSMNGAALMAEAPRYRILFVDDEEPVLDGLRNLLRRQRHEWDMVFAVGSAAGLAQIEESRLDLVISDMRMPGMEGAELLERVRDLQPGAARIVLSGYSEQESQLGAVPVAHLMLAKPCDADVLKAVISRTCALQAILADEDMREIVRRVEPAHERNHSSADLDALNKIFERDPALASRVLRLASSACFAMPSPSSSVPHAVAVVGIVADFMLRTRCSGKAECGPTAQLDQTLFERLGISPGRPRSRVIADAEERRVEDNH